MILSFYGKSQNLTKIREISLKINIDSSFWKEKLLNENHDSMFYVFMASTKMLAFP